MADEYEWLREEMAAVKTPRFFGTVGASKAAVHGVPASYVRFLREFGPLGLYRRHGRYKVRVGIAGEVPGQEYKGHRILQFGRYGFGNPVYFRRMDDDSETTVLAWDGHLIRDTGKAFPEWLRIRGRAARRDFKAAEWRKVLEGPPPFSEPELEVLRVRRGYRLRQIGADTDGQRIEVENRGRGRLAALTLLVHHDGQLVGLRKLPCDGVGPGERAVITVRGYEHVPQDQQVCELAPDPGPEDRGVYWELPGDEGVYWEPTTRPRS